MKYVDDDSYEWKRYADPEKYEYVKQQHISSIDINDITHPPQAPFMFKCLKCGARYMEEKCNNCGSNEIRPGHGNEGSGVFCWRCNEGISKWTCEKCGCSNPASNTFHTRKSKGGCFIATAVYGSANSPEVILLKHFRDKVLQQSKLGRITVDIYYCFSPFIARFLSNKEALKKVVKYSIIEPAVNILKKNRR